MMKSLNKRKKTLISVVIVAALLCALLYVLAVCIDKYNAQKVQSDATQQAASSNPVPSIIFYDADFDENIFENQEYMQKNAFVKYTKGGVSYYITQSIDQTEDEYASFFVNYFEKVKLADKSYADMFSQSYEHSYDYIASPDSEFAPQMIYDIEVSRFETQNDHSLESDTQYAFFEVKYKIFHNNGTYRRDLPEDGMKPLLFKLSNTGGKIKIESITDFAQLD